MQRSKPKNRSAFLSTPQALLTCEVTLSNKQTQLSEETTFFHQAPLAQVLRLVQVLL